MAILNSSTLTPREYELQQHEKEMWEKSAAHQIQMKQLEIEAQKLDAKISAWLRLPLFIIMLPVRILFGIAYCIAVARKYELPNSFWDFMRR